MELPLAKGFLSPANGGNEGGVKTIERRDSKNIIIMANQLKYAFRLTHIDNIQYIMSHGLVRSVSTLRDENYVPIGDVQVIQIRKDRKYHGYCLSDYMPFYFGPRSPMLYVIQHDFNGVRKVVPENIVYCVVRIEDIIKNNISCIFTDGHALSSLTNYYSKNELAILDRFIKYDDVYSAYWNSEMDIDLKRRKEAELLINDDLPVQYIRGFVVYNETAKTRLINIGVAAELIVVKPGFYF